jgi:glutaredoxin
MRKITMFTMESCPYCVKARRWMNHLLEECPEYRKIELVIIDEVEQPALADTFDYYYVPTFYVDGTKVHEGVPTQQIIRDVFQLALKG